MDIYWENLLAKEQKKPYFESLQTFVDTAYAETIVYPAEENIYQALKLTPYQQVKVVILGQDPYHGPHQAHGLSFSIASEEAKFPPSLRNIFKELATDVGIERTNKNLTDWAEQGVLLLNTVLTVEAGKAASHRNQGWEILTDCIIQALNLRAEPIIFVLWGADARKKVPLLTNSQHKIIECVHPSPLSAHRGFFGSKPFSQINHYLTEANQKPIQWGG
ncbi:uracil-DNA glycosylase [Isobaculum melis]|uniref:Uracil-DNA glycosylase n=1 Tax=Isobaculum melis TaxID=142588 RepID=A0A1H9QFD7_9LACT|nr:uracil-DNA glycosylase [Isobaculum melis]SER58885.1 Uracil-DNA glycosylase [Isobaculum melis]